MKNIIFIIAIVLGFQCNAQKTLEIYNFTSQSIDIADIITRAGATFAYPEYHSKSCCTITLPPGGSYVLENTSNVYRFPFYSPTSVPYINQWGRYNSFGAMLTLVPSNVAWTLGNNQVFYDLIFNDGSNDYRHVGETNFTDGPINGITADYAWANPSTNVFIYTIVFY